MLSLKTSRRAKLATILVLALGVWGCDRPDSGAALGTLERDRVALTATAAELVVDLPVAEGSAVKKGDVLVRLDDTQQRAAVSAAKAQVAQAEATLEKERNGAREEELAAARAKVAGAKAALVEARQTYQRTADLNQRGTASKASYDSALANRDAADATLKSAEEELRQLVNGTRPEDLKIAEAELAAAKASLESEQQSLENLTVRASRDGRLDSLPWNLGERVTTGSPVAILLAGDSPHVRAYVPEPYRAKVHEGMNLQVRVDGQEGEIEGTVRWISSEPAFTPYYALNQEDRARLMYLVEVQLPASADSLPSGLPAQVILP